MELNKESLKGKWNEIKGDVQKAWGRLTDDEIEQTKGDFTKLKGLIQQKYGEQKEDVQRRFSDIVNKYDVDESH